MTIKDFLLKYKNVELTEEQEKHIREYLGINNKKWKPKKGYRYYYINDTGHADFSIYYNNDMDNYRVLTNNCFKTIEEAMFRLEQIKVYNELKNFADENNEEIDWGKSTKGKFYLYYVHEDKKINVSSTCYWQGVGQIYFSSSVLAYRVIEKVGVDRIKKYLFGVDLC